jgi:hypothetical protein
MILLVSAAYCAGEPGAPRVPVRVVAAQGGLYTVQLQEGQRAHAVLIALQEEPGAPLRRLSLPMGVAAPVYPGNHVAWDLAGVSIVAVSVQEVAPGQRSFGLIGTPLATLKPVRSVRPEIRGYPRILDHLAGVEPVDNALLRAEIEKRGPVFFDLSAEGKGNIQLHVLADGKLTGWKLEGEDWRLIRSLTAPFEGPFRMILQPTSLHLLTGMGDVYLVADVGMEPLGNVSDLWQGRGSPVVLLEDTETSTHYLLRRLEGGSLDWDGAVAIVEDTMERRPLDATMKASLEALEQYLRKRGQP